MIAKFKKTSRSRWAGAMLLLAVLACVVLTNAYVAKADFTFGTPTNLGPPVNTSSADVSPRLSADGLSLYFESNRPGGQGGFDIWVTTRETTSDPWGEPTNLGPTVNSSTYDIQPCISADELELYFGSNRTGGSGTYDMWVSTRASTDDLWGTPVNLGSTLNKQGLDGTPNISADGLTLFFGSDRPGGHGDADIYVTTRATRDDPWEEPENLGPTVNSAYGEVYSSVSSDELMLFFSSAGFASPRPGGYGRSDIWVTTRKSKDEPWGEPMNLGPAVNTSAADNSPNISSDGSTLSFHSDRPGGIGTVDI